MDWELGTGCPIMAVLEEAAKLGEQYVEVIRNLRKDMCVCSHPTLLPATTNDDEKAREKRR